MFGGKWGYVNKRGELVIPIHFKEAHPHSNGLALVSTEDAESVFIDLEGSTVFEFPNCRSRSFREGVAPVYVNQSSERQELRTDYVDASGKVEFTIAGTGGRFHEGLAVFNIRASNANSEEQYLNGYIDRSGKVVIPPQFPAAGEFSEGLAAVQVEKTTSHPSMGGLWGYIDSSGKILIKPRYNEVRPFKDGKAIVHEGGKINHREDTPSVWEGGRWMEIDALGKVLRILDW